MIPENKQTSSDLSKKITTSDPVLQRADSEPSQQGGSHGGQPEDQGTPTQDEQQPTMIMQSASNTSSSTSSKPVGTSTNLPPSLNTLPLFEKLDKLELAQQEIKRKGN